MELMLASTASSSEDFTLLLRRKKRPAVAPPTSTRKIPRKTMYFLASLSILYLIFELETIYYFEKVFLQTF
jgi:hypothetical protein